MKAILYAAAIGLTALYATAATAQPIRTRVYPAPVIPVPLPPGIEPEDVQDYQIDQLERRQQIQRAALNFRQKVERHYIDPDDED